MAAGKARPFFSAVIVAAGSSSRMGGKVRKPYLKLRGKPVLVWTLRAMAKVRGLREIVLVTRPEDRAMAQRVAKSARLPRSLALRFADGGARRQDSVFNGLNATDPRAQLVLIQDAARPFADQRAMAAACDAALKGGAAILACRIKDTIKREAATGTEKGGAVAIETTVPRAGLWAAQTPQVFQRELILTLFKQLFAQRPQPEVTDDASVCELFNQPVALIEASDTNFKVTRPEDIAIAEAYLRAGVV